VENIAPAGPARKPIRWFEMGGQARLARTQGLQSALGSVLTDDYI